jgi:GT2 family glycosyltransferase
MRPFLAPAPPHGPVRPRTGPPTFSIAVAAYQAAGTIDEALASAFAQTFPPLEVIVCDDGSTDDLDGVLEPWRDRIVLLRRPHRGTGAAKDAATRAARGEFVVLLDADDAFLPERLEAIAELAHARPDLDVIGTDAYIEHEGRVLRRTYDETWPFEIEDQRTEILRRNFVVAHVAVRRERLLGVGGFDPAMTSVDDWELWVRVILGGGRVGIVDEPLALYRVRETSLSAQPLRRGHGSVAALERAAARTDLAAHERETVEEALAGHRRQLALAELDDALLRRAGGVHRHALAILRDAGHPGATRVKAAAAALAPPVARLLLERRARRGWIGTAGIHVSRSASAPEAAADRTDEAAEPPTGVAGEPRGVVRRDDAEGGGEQREREGPGERSDEDPREPAQRRDDPPGQQARGG